MPSASRFFFDRDAWGFVEITCCQLAIDHQTLGAGPVKWKNVVEGRLLGQQVVWKIVMLLLRAAKTG